MNSINQSGVFKPSKIIPIRGKSSKIVKPTKIASIRGYSSKKSFTLRIEADIQESNAKENSDYIDFLESSFQSQERFSIVLNSYCDDSFREITYLSINEIFIKDITQLIIGYLYSPHVNFVNEILSSIEIGNFTDLIYEDYLVNSPSSKESFFFGTFIDGTYFIYSSRGKQFYWSNSPERFLKVGYLEVNDLYWYPMLSRM